MKYTGTALFNGTSFVLDLRALLKTSVSAFLYAVDLNRVQCVRVHMYYTTADDRRHI